MSMYALFNIPLQDKVLIYRPLLELAFVGNRQLAELAAEFCEQADLSVLSKWPEVSTFFESVGFLRPDPDRQPETDISLFRPTAAALLMTNRCNLRCIYCYANGGEENLLDLSEEPGRQAIDIVARNAQERGLSAFSVTFHGGGEPTLNRRALIELARYARKKPIRAELALVSNGLWSSEYCTELMGLLDGLTISMDGGQTTQDRQRPDAAGRGSFERVMRTVRQLSERCFPFNIRVTSTPERFSALAEDMCFLCQNSGAGTIQVEPAFNHERGAHSMARHEERELFCRSFLEAYDVVTGLGRELFYSGARPWKTTGEFCTAPLGGSLTVNPLGEITGCYESTGRQGSDTAIFGRLDEGGLHLDEEKRLRFMRGVLQRKDRCQACFCRYQCAGDCFTRGLPEPEGPWPYTRCEINREISLGLILRSIQG